MLPAMIPAMTVAGPSAELDLDRERSSLWRGDAVPLPFTWLWGAAWSDSRYRLVCVVCGRGFLEDGKV
jgi:hypothetical protein